MCGRRGYASLLEAGVALTFDASLPQGGGPSKRRLGSVVDRPQVRDRNGRTPEPLLPDRRTSSSRFRHATTTDTTPPSASSSGTSRSLGMLPHMHMRGREPKYTAFYPDGTDRAHPPRARLGLRLTRRSTGYSEPKVLPKGTRLRIEMPVRQLLRRGGTLGLQSRSQRGVRPAVDRRDADGLPLLRLQRRGGAAGESAGSSDRDRGRRLAASHQPPNP